VDISSRPEVEAFVAEAAGDSGIDILVNNAGGVLGQVGRPLEEITPDEWQGIFNVNVTGAFYCSQAAAPGMKRARRGRIINISSGAGLGISLTGIQAYASAKAAQIGLTASSPMSSAPGASPSIMWRPASFAPTRRRSGNGTPMAPRGSAGWWRASR
jgi:NAD(P)-dependent dehydrogenase (short-subunit alcohol dehydrogenase family)